MINKLKTNRNHYKILIKNLHYRLYEKYFIIMGSNLSVDLFCWHPDSDWGVRLPVGGSAQRGRRDRGEQAAAPRSGETQGGA